jgi:ABC-type multidrug transport system fused ATPase/permease subunit
MNTYLRNFLLILAAGLLSAVVGGLFGAGIALLSPEFVSGLFFTPKSGNLARYAAAVGAVWGLFIGAGTMAFVIGVAAMANWFRPKI